MNGYKESTPVPRSSFATEAAGCSDIAPKVLNTLRDRLEKENAITRSAIMDLENIIARMTGQYPGPQDQDGELRKNEPSALENLFRQVNEAAENNSRLEWIVRTLNEVA